MTHRLYQELRIGSSWQIGVVVLLLVMSHPVSCRAGTLEEFDKQLSKPPVEKNDTHHHGHKHANGNDSFFSSLFTDIFIRPIFMLAGSGGAVSMARAEGDGTQRLGITARNSGDALIPFVRMDVYYQPVSTDVTGVDLRGEIGYGALGVSVRHTSYDEKSSGDNLQATQLHGLYRMSIGDHVEVDAGLGFEKLVYSGKATAQTLKIPGTTDRFNGPSAALAVSYHPSDYVGLEVRPAWSMLNGHVVGDYNITFLAGVRFVKLHFGYRWMETGTQSISGPHAGLSAFW